MTELNILDLEDADIIDLGEVSDQTKGPNGNPAEFLSNQSSSD